MNESITNGFVAEEWYKVDATPGKRACQEVLFVESPSADESVGCWLTFDYDYGLVEDRAKMAETFKVKRTMIVAWEQVEDE